jgi:hypothetical protein
MHMHTLSARMQRPESLRGLCMRALSVRMCIPNNACRIMPAAITRIRNGYIPVVQTLQRTMFGLVFSVHNASHAEL